MKRLFLTLAVAALTACPSKSSSIIVTPAPTDDLPPPLTPVMVTSDDIAACAAIGVVGCPEAPSCVTTIGQARTEHVVIPSACLKAATNAAMVRACGDISTLRFECANPQ